MSGMVKLRPLLRHNATLTFGVFFIVCVLSVITLIVGRLLDAATIGYFCAAILLLAGLVAGSWHTAKASLKSTDFLARAILHVSREHTSVGAPNVALLPAGREFMESLAHSVYNMASAGGSAHAAEKKSTSDIPESLLLQMPIAVYALDKDQRLVYANQAGIDYAKLTPNSIGVPVHDAMQLSFTSDETLENWLAGNKESRATSQQSWQRVKLSLHDGTNRQFDMSAHFNKDNPDGVETVIAMFDNTEKYKTDDRGAGFVSLAVHELRTPLTTMRGYIEVFEDEIAGSLDAEQQDFLQKLSAQAEQLASFVSNIQNFARIEDGDLSLAMKDEDFGEIVKIAVGDMQQRAKVRRKSLQLIVDDNLPRVAVDRTTIYEVLINIIENAIKYTHNDEPIKIHTYKKDDNFVETTIEDKGIGINAALMGHVFEKFYRSHRSNKAVSGTGLGLYLSRTIVKAHGGDIWVKSKEGEGSTFGFTVPTLASVAEQINESGNQTIIRGAHGWIKNHEFYKG